MKRLSAFLLCLVLALSLIPAAAAEDIVIVDVDEPELEVPEDEDLIEIVEPEDDPAELPNSTVASGTCGDDMQWYLYSTGELHLTGSGEMWDFANVEVPWKDYLDSIKTLTIDNGITSIGQAAFAGCSNLKLNPDILDGLEGINTIGYAAFARCTSLDYVFIPDSVTFIAENAFLGCTSLKHMTIAGSPTISDDVFTFCSALESISLLSGTAPSFADFSFGGVQRITVYYPPNGSGYSACVGKNFGGELSWSEGLHGWCGDDVDWELDSNGQLQVYGVGPTWPDPSFRVRAGSITSAYVSPGVTDLAAYFFYYLTNLRELTLPDGITAIGNYCFYGDPISSIEIPSQVTEIGQSAFVNTHLTDIRFRGHAPTISTSAFSGMSGVTARYYPLADWTESVWSRLGGSITWICDDKLGRAVTWKLSSAGKLTLSGSGETWDYGEEHPGYLYVSDDCKSLSVGSGVTELGDELFYGLDQLKTASLPKSLTGIGSYAFGNCVALERISFFGSAPSFGSYAFGGIRSLTARYPASDTSWTSSVRKSYGADSVTWVAVEKPTITTQPTSKTASVGTTVKFTVKASGVGLSYQWYYRTGSTGEWKKSTSTGNKTATLSVKATSARDGFQFCCRVSNVGGYRYSKSATLTVGTKPVITTQPTSKTAAAGTDVKFKVAATGATSYQWQYRKSASGTWYNSTSTGNKTATLTVTATEARNGFQFRCKVTNAAGTTNSSYAKLTVVTKPTITTQPTSRTVTAGTTVKFKVAATGGGLSYQWQYRKSSSDSWHNCTSTGAKTAEMTLTATAARNGFQFRCVITNAAGTTNSNYAKLTVK